MASFLCECGGDTRVTDSRQTEAKTTRRRRQCVTCGLRITTYEIELAKYHGMLAELRGLYKLAGRVVRKMGPER